MYEYVYAKYMISLYYNMYFWAKLNEEKEMMTYFFNKSL